MKRGFRDCIAASVNLSDEDNTELLAQADRIAATGASYDDAMLEAANLMLGGVADERAEIVRMTAAQNPQVQLLMPAANDAARDDARPSDPDAEPAQSNFTRPDEWTEELFTGGMRMSGRGDTRSAMAQVLDTRNRSLKRVNPASVLEADIARGAEAITYVESELRAGNSQATEVPLGPVPHVLHMLGAQMQMMQMHTNIVRKVLVDKHSEDFAGVSPREFIEAIYKPALVTQARAADEWEVTTTLANAKGDPITVIIKSNTEMPVAGRPGKPVKVASVLSAYARPLTGVKDSLLQRVLTGKARYADVGKAQAVVINQLARSSASRTAQPSSASIPAEEMRGKADSLWRQFGQPLISGISERKIKDDVALMRFIGDNYLPGNTPAGWGDAPSFSRRGDEAAQPLYVSRPVANASDILAWARSQGIENLEPPEKLHVTVAFSRDPVSPAAGGDAPGQLVSASGERDVKRLGDEGAVVLRIDSPELDARWQAWRDAGASWDFESYQPHVTLTYDPGKVDLTKVQPYRGAVVLGPEKAEPLELDEPKDDGVFDLMADPGGPPQTETAEFKRWFGDSKVVDAQGNPLVVYHGTNASFDVFDPTKTRATEGVFLTPDPQRAGAYAGRDAGANLMPVYVSLQNPSEIELRNYSVDNLDAAMTRGGTDGLVVRDDDGTVHSVIALRPEQIKSAIGNVGFFDTNNTDIRYSRRSRLPGQYNLRDFNVGHQFIEAIQNRYNRWKHAIEDIVAQGGRLTEASDFYRAEERYWGVTGARMEDFGQELQAFVDDVARDRLTLDDVALFAYAQHAEERNDWIAGQRATMPDGGSGMLTQDARDLLNEARAAGLEPDLARHAATLRGWIQGTRDLLFNEGLIDQNEFDAWSNMFQSYVPLRGLDGAPEARGTGQGFNIRGREGKSAMGRKSQARQIIEQVVQDRTRALTRAGKNQVLRSFAQFVIDNPSPNLWEINAVETKPVTTVDANGDRVIDEQQVIISDDRTVTVKDGGQEIHILVNDDRLLEQLKNLNADNPSRIVGGFLWANRILSKLYTALNPVFTVLNGARDLQAATIGAIDDIGFMAVPRLYANLPKALWDAYRAEAGSFSPDYTEYRQTGGKTGFFEFRTLDAQTEELQRLIADAERSAIDPRKFGPKAMHLIEAMNAGIENAVRLAAFKTARQSGMTLAEAAHISKNITVNFNRRGTMTPTLSAWFLFFNPAVQGTARIAKAVQNPKVLATLGAGMLGIAALALRNAGMGEDDDGVAWWDKIPDEVKERNIIIVLPPGVSKGEQVPGSKIGRYAKVPMPYGYNFFAVVANQVVDVYRNATDPRRGRTWVSGGAKAFSAWMNAWLPVSELGKSLETPAAAVLTAVPDALNPVAQVLINTSSFGRKLYPDDQHSQHQPDSSKFFPAQAGTLYQRAAEAMNAATGGNRYQSGLLDVTPATLETMARGYGGGPVGFTMDLVNAVYARQSIQRTTPRYEALPFVKQLYGVIDAETDRMIGYQRLEQAAGMVEPLQRAQREGGFTEAQEMRDEFGPMLMLGGTIQQTRQRLSDLRKRELAVVSSPENDAMKFARLEALAELRRKTLQQFNAAYDRAIVAQAEAKKRAAGQ